MALNVLQRDKTIKDNIRGKRLRAGWDQDALVLCHSLILG